MIWCAALGSFALSSSYVLALLLLFVAGFVELSFNSMAQTLVQLNAPPEMRGRAIGVYNMFAMGMRTFSGVPVGLVGARIGIHWALAGSAARSEEHTSALQSLMRISYAVFCLKK